MIPVNPGPWITHTIPPGAETSVRIGPLRVRFRREGDELWVGSGPVPGAQAGNGLLPERGWSRWALPAGAASGIHLTPALPDRLLVVKPQTPFHLAPGADARIYVRVPVSVGVRLGDATGPLLVEFPSLLLSDTWWGDLEDGSLGYFLNTSARRALTPDLLEPHLAVCAMNLENESDEPLPVEKLALRVVHLSMFGLGSGLWSEEVRVRYGGDEESHIEMTGTPPAEAGTPPLLAAPRIPAPRGIRARTFARLKGFSGIGGGG